MAEPKVLTQIAPTAWEHPADRAALNTLRALPGFDDVLRRVMGLLGERGVRHLFTANAVRVGPRQRPKLDALYTEVLATLDWSERPDLFVSQTPFANAMAVGFERPFIVVNSGAVGLLERDEHRVILGHELGHVMSGHATYTTLALIILNIGFNNIPGLGLIALPIQLALLEWQRKAELSSDRAALLATQDLEASMRLFLKFAGGTSTDDEVSLEEFMAQADEYETGGGALDTVFKVLNVAFRTHPFNTVRAAELRRWVQSGAYDRIIGGDYPRRGESRGGLGDDYAEAASHYRQQARGAMDQVADVLRTARDAVAEVFRGVSGG
ncbi:MAG: M48 family metallopeptidase, partial [Gemmatimonadaceae bacterium]|nr:M48 family metallopeptidase [Gemmatimonadaceae bacterium]